MEIKTKFFYISGLLCGGFSAEFKKKQKHVKEHEEREKSQLFCPRDDTLTHTLSVMFDS